MGAKTVAIVVVLLAVAAAIGYFVYSGTPSPAPVESTSAVVSTHRDGGSTSTVSTTSVSTPAVSTPAVSTPVVSTPVVSTPAAVPPVVSTPAVPSSPSQVTLAWLAGSWRHSSGATWIIGTDGAVTMGGAPNEGTFVPASTGGYKMTWRYGGPTDATIVSVTATVVTLSWFNGPARFPVTVTLTRM